MSENDDDQRWIVVDGRRWRATDPSIPEPFRKELVAELMDARRAVGAATRADDADAERAARDRVQDAKVALGERGAPWWEQPTAEQRRTRLAAAMLAIARHRGPAKTTCPSDAARAVGGERWRSAMDDARTVARELTHAGAITVEQKGEPIDPDGRWRGPVRLRITGVRGAAEMHG